MSDKEYVKTINTVSMVTLAGNAILSLAKLLTGIFAFSAALVSDAAHSLSDCFSTVVVIIGVHISSKKSDREHPYGHERMECIAALILSAMLLVTAFAIGWQGVNTIIEIANGATMPAPTLLAVVVSIISVVFKGWMYLYTEKYAKKLKSTALHGDAVHHLSDSLSSIGALVGIVGAMLGVAVLDSVASILIGLMIVKAAWDICCVAVNQLVDRAADESVEEIIRQEVLSTAGVEGIDVLRTRQYGNKIFVDVEIAVRADLSLIEAHHIAELVHERVEHGKVSDVKHCMVHVNPLSCEDHHESPHEEMY